MKQSFQLFESRSLISPCRLSFSFSPSSFFYYLFSYAVLFFASIYVAGIAVQRFLGMPALVGEILIGILLGPSLLNIVPIPEAFVLLGEIGYV